VQAESDRHSVQRARVVRAGRPNHCRGANCGTQAAAATQADACGLRSEHIALILEGYERQNSSSPACGTAWVRAFNHIFESDQRGAAGVVCVCRSSSRHGKPASKVTSYRAITVTNRILAVMYCAFLDVASAFDSVCREDLTVKLYSVGIRGKVLAFLRASPLMRYTRSIRSEGVLDDEVRLAGVSQGTVGPRSASR
jgi:hypothetical protein